MDHPTRLPSGAGAPVRRTTGRVALLLAALGTLATLAGAPAPAEAVVYCKTVGVPKGCVARPVAPAARAAVYCTRPGYPVGCVGRPAAPAARTAAYCTRPGYPVGCVGRPAGARGPGVAPANLGGPVNRVGVR